LQQTILKSQMKISLIILLQLIFYYGLSQQVELAWGPYKEFNRSSIEYGFIGKVKGDFYTHRKEDKTIFLAKTRISDMSQTFEKPIKWNDTDPATKNDEFSFNSMQLFKGNFLFFYEKYSPKQDKQRIFGQKISYDGQPVDASVELSIRDKNRRSKDGSFQLTFSADSTNFLITTKPYFEKYANEKFQFKIFDNQLKLLHNLEIELPFRDADFSVESITLSKSKLIYLLAKVNIPKKERKDDEATYYYDLVTIDPVNKGKATEFELKLDKKYINQVDLILDQKDNPKCFGFYTDMKDNGKPKDGINGVFYFYVNNGKVENLGIKEFDAALVTDLAGKKRAKKDKGIETHFRIKNFFNKPDGGAIILGEEQYVIVVTTRSSNGATTTSYHYHTESILEVNIDGKGKILWYAHIPKKQVTINDNRFLSFHALYVKGKTYIIYNDESNNAVTKSYDKVMKNVFKTVPVMVTVNESGKSDKILLNDIADKQGFTLKPNISDRISDTQAFFYADKLKKGIPCCFIGGRGKPSTQRVGILTVK